MNNPDGIIIKKNMIAFNIDYCQVTPEFFPKSSAHTVETITQLEKVIPFQIWSNYPNGFRGSDDMRTIRSGFHVNDAVDGYYVTVTPFKDDEDIIIETFNKL